MSEVRLPRAPSPFELDCESRLGVMNGFLLSTIVVGGGKGENAISGESPIALGEVASNFLELLHPEPGEASSLVNAGIKSSRKSRSSRLDWESPVPGANAVWNSSSISFR